jgi:hypothetical protein
MISTRPPARVPETLQEEISKVIPFEVRIFHRIGVLMTLCCLNGIVENGGKLCEIGRVCTTSTVFRMDKYKEHADKPYFCDNI